MSEKLKVIVSERGREKERQTDREILRDKEIQRKIENESETKMRERNHVDICNKVSKTYLLDNFYILHWQLCHLQQLECQ